MLRFDIITIFPEMFTAITESGVTRRALQRGLWVMHTWNLRNYSTRTHKNVDDRPFGGGPGMVFQVDPIEATIASIQQARKDNGCPVGPVIFLSPQGATLQQSKVQELSKGAGSILLCGRYEGIDERAIESCVDEEISIGDFVLSGGEIAAMALMDACVRQIPGALQDAASAHEESFAEGLLDCPHYTRPEVSRGRTVPAVLLEGNHAKIQRWRLQQKLGRTWLRRPDLLAKYSFNTEEKKLLAEFQQQYVQQKASEPLPQSPPDRSTNPASNQREDEVRYPAVLFE